MNAMNRFHTFLRRLLPAVAFATALLLTGATVVAGVHNHGSTTDHACAVCTMAHATSDVAVVAGSAPAPQRVDERVLEYAAASHIPAPVGIRSSRAPPLV